MLSGCLIFVAMVFDGLDGYVARLARTSSDFGAQLDSLCDVVSFGVAPGFLLVKMCPQFTFLHDQAVWVIAAAFAACAALRLARFNVETQRRRRSPAFQRAAQSGGGGGGRRVRHHVLHAAPGHATPLKDASDRRVLQTHPAVLRAAGGAADGFADPLSAHYQPRVARPAEFRPRGGGGVRLRGLDGVRGYAVPIVACCVRPLWAGPPGLGESGSSGGIGRTAVLRRENDSMFSGIVEALGTVVELRRSRPAAG